MDDKKRYPNISMIIGIVYSLMYAVFIMSIFIDKHEITFAFLSVSFLVVYWYAMYSAKKKFTAGDFTVAKARLVNIGGFFLFFFATSFTCLNYIGHLQ